MKKEVRDLIRKLEKQGFDVVRAKNGHYKVYRDGAYLATFPSSPSDWRALRNTVAQLKKLGFRP